MTKGFLSRERLMFGPWQALERSVGRLLCHLGFLNVNLIGGPNDQGGDILAQRNGESWVFQVKFSLNSAINSDSVSEVVHACKFYTATRAVVVTNSLFSDQAYRQRDFYKSIGIQIDLWDRSILETLFSQCDEYPSEPRPLFPYQDKAVMALLEAFRNPDKQNALLLMATGLGKTYVVSNFISSVLKYDSSLRILVLAHMKDLVLQLESAFIPHLGKSIATHILTGEEKPSFDEGITFATIQSVFKLQSLKRGTFDIIIVDEAHHIGSETYQEILRFLSPRFLIGITATPWRLDKFKLNDFFGEPVFSISLVEGMDQGYLAEVDYKMLMDNVNWDELKKLNRGKYSIRELNQLLFLPARDHAVIENIQNYWKLIEKPRAIIFCRTINHAQIIAGMLNSIGFCNAFCISSETLKRDRDVALKRFREGSLDVLVTVDLLNEGIDVPQVNLIAFLRVTHSRRIFVQQLGRGLRLSKNKTHVIVLDFVADIRRIAAGLELELEHQRFKSHHPEILNLPDSIIRFSDTGNASFFKEWLSDISDIEDADEQMRFEFPPP